MDYDFFTPTSTPLFLRRLHLIHYFNRLFATHPLSDSFAHRRLRLLLSLHSQQFHKRLHRRTLS